VLGGLAHINTAAAEPIARAQSIKASTADTIWMSKRMMAAMQANDPIAIEQLVGAGESVNACHIETGARLITWASSRGHTDLVRFLLGGGADIEEKATEGESPLMLAARYGHTDTVRLLLHRAADPFYVTYKGWDVRRFAEMGKNSAIQAILAKLWQGKSPVFHRSDVDER
jgi:ankyrin repeat protein